MIAAPINPSDVLTLTGQYGMLPPLPLSRFRQVGNAAGAGAKLVLSSCSTRRSARELARRIGYIELAATDGFMQQFVRHTYLNRWKELKG